MPAKASPSDSPGKGGTKNPPAKVSPTRSKFMGGMKNFTEVKKTKPRASGWHIQACLCDGLLAYFTVTLPDPANDAYTQPLTEIVGSNEEEIEHDVTEIGIIGSFFMRRSRKDNSALKNKKNDFTKKAYVLLLDTDEHNPEVLYQKLEIVKDFLEQPENNRFGTKVFLDKDTFDLTPPESEPLPKSQLPSK